MSSFYLEMAVIDSLRNARVGHTAANVLQALEHFRDKIETTQYINPANTNNIVSDGCTQAEKAAIAAKARESLGKKTWGEIVW